MHLNLLIELLDTTEFPSTFYTISNISTLRIPLIYKKPHTPNIKIFLIDFKLEILKKSQITLSILNLLIKIERKYQKRNLFAIKVI